MLDNTIPMGPQDPGWIPASGESSELPDGLTVEIGDDGSVTLSLPDKPDERSDKPSAHDANLAEKIDGASLADRVLEGIEADKTSRAPWVSTYTQSLELLGLKVEQRDGTKATRGSISRIRDSLLLEAVIKAQSLARGELLPAGGPCKANVLGQTNPDMDLLAEHFQSDMNAYLTVGAREYYPDFDRGLFGHFFSGNLFRKVYVHPLRRRPCCDSIDVEDMIVSEDATDLDTAVRVTHRTYVTPAVCRRMQIAGYWLDDPLPHATPDTSSERLAEQELLGVRPAGSQRPQDQERCILECTTDLDLSEYGLSEPGQPEGLPIPYVVTIDQSSRRLLALRRGWAEGDRDFTRRQRFVHYGMIPALGFLCLGYMHLLGNATKALTAMTRIVCDLGMYSCFPGGVKAKGVRLATNQLSPEPGEWVDADIAGMEDIRRAMMPMPYNAQAIPALVAAIDMVRKQAQGLGNAPEVETGEGRTNVPVGTIMAQIEQQTQVSAAVHKRLHSAQARELQMLKELIAESPEVLDRVIPNPSRRWAAVQEFANVDLVPASDPNVPSTIHRMMRATALVQVADSAPDLYDRAEAHKRAWREAGMSDVEDLIHSPQGQGPDPKIQAGQLQLQAKQLDVQMKQQDASRKAAEETVEAQRHQTELTADMQNSAADRASKERIAGMQRQTEQLRIAADMRKADAQMQHERGLAQMDAAHEQMREHQAQQHEAEQAGFGRQHEAEQTAFSQAHEADQVAIGQKHERDMQSGLGAPSAKGTHAERH